MLTEIPLLTIISKKAPRFFGKVVNQQRQSVKNYEIPLQDICLFVSSHT